MLEIVVGVVGFIIVAFAVWWTDRVKKYYEDED